MDRLREFLKKTYLTILFLAIECFAVYFYVNGSVYSRAIVLNAASQGLNRFQERLAGIGDYFRLGTVNEELARQNSLLTRRVLSLESELNLQHETLTALEDSTLLDLPASDNYFSTPATVVRNSTNRQNNYITLNKGSRDGIERHMSVVSGEAIVGYIVSVSRNYSIALSALSQDFKTSGMLRKDQSLCLVYWDGIDENRLTFNELSKYAPVQEGDTLVTTGFSTLFPPGMTIGTVGSIEAGDRTFLRGTIVPTVDFTKLKYVTILEHSFVKERRELERQVLPQ